jgi:anti-sigma B factor antagonist
MQKTGSIEITIDYREQIAIISLSGELTTKTYPYAQTQIFPLVKANALMLLEMSKISYMSSAGLRLMLALYRRITNLDGRLVIVGLSDSIRDVMEITGFLSFFSTYENLEDGIKALIGGETDENTTDQ